MTFTRSIIITYLILILFNSCSHEPVLIKTKVLSELSNPHEIISDNNHLIISDGIEGTSIFIYSIEDLSLFSQFGGTGDTTGKFIVSGGHAVGMDIRNDTLLISSHWKASFFTKAGSFIKELPIGNDTYNYGFLNNKFAGMDDTTVNNSMYYTFNLYDEQFDFEKEITRIAGSNQGSNGLQVLVRRYQDLIYKDNFYFKGKSEGFEIEKYDSSGDKTDVISQNYKRVAVEETHKNDVYTMYEEHPLFGQFFDAIKEQIVFPEYLPAIYNINIADDFIYALTYELDSTGTVLYKLDLEGKLIDILNVPLKWKGATETYPYTVSNGYLYQLVENKSENWELEIIKL